MDRFSVEFFDDDDRTPEWCVIEWNINAEGKRTTGTTVERFYCEADALEHLYCMKMEHAFGGSGYVNL